MVGRYRVPGSLAVYGHPPGNDIAAGDVRRCGPSPSIRIGSFKQEWGIYLTLGVGNMLTLDRVALRRIAAHLRKCSSEGMGPTPLPPYGTLN